MDLGSGWDGEEETERRELHLGERSQWRGPAR